MTEKKGIFFLIASGCMEICWLYAWSSFSLTAIVGNPYPFSGAIASFLAAATLTYFSINKGWRHILILISQVAGLLLAALWIIHVMYFRSYGIFDKAWYTQILTFLQTPLDWIIFIIANIFTLLFWISGIFFIKRPKEYFKICGRFDLGLIAFFGLFLLKLVLLVKGGIKIDDPVSSAFIFPYFLFALIAIASARNDNSARGFLPGYKGIGFAAVIISSVLLAAGGMVLFFLPALSRTAEIGYNAFKNTRGFFSAFVTILRFLFSPRNIRQDPAGSSSKAAEFDIFLHEEGGWFFMLMEYFVKWVVPILLISLAGFISFFIIRQWIYSIIKRILFIIKWLFSRSSVTVKNSSINMSWFVRLIIFIKLISRIILKRYRKQLKAFELFKMLQTWGRRSGIPFNVNMTALEYSLRLNRSFPVFKTEIDIIVNAFNIELYGRGIPGEVLLNSARSAFRELKSPLHWPLRLKHLIRPGR